MPANPSVLKAISAIRKVIASSGTTKRPGFELYSSITSLFRQSEKIVGDAETLDAVLAFAPEIEAFRGQGSQMAASEFSRSISYLVFRMKERLPLSASTPERFMKEEEIPPSAKDVLDCFEKHAAHAYARTMGKPVRSQHAGHLRATAWETLARISEVLHRPEHLAHALKVAADTRASTDERQAAIGFLISYWGSDDPDEVTATLLWQLERNPPDRTFLVTVLQAQIDLGLNDEFGALASVDDWEDAEEEK